MLQMLYVCDSEQNFFLDIWRYINKKYYYYYIVIYTAVFDIMWARCRAAGRRLCQETCQAASHHRRWRELHDDRATNHRAALWEPRVHAAVVHHRLVTGEWARSCFAGFRCRDWFYVGVVQLCFFYPHILVAVIFGQVHEICELARHIFIHWSY